MTVGLYKKGHCCASARERHALGLCTSEGKDPIPITALLYLCETLHNSKDPEHVAALFFLLFDWNRISHTDYIVNAHIDLFGIMNDALLCHVVPSKGDQERVKHTNHPFHIYSVPETPIICPVLDFAHYLIYNPSILNGGGKLFEGSTQYELV